jgi:SAM-dependent methyltransferase
MDLGTGPGSLAVAFAPLAGAVVGIDPEPAMLALAAEHAAGAQVPVQWLQADSASLAPELGSFRLVTMGRSFHWMDRPRTLEQLERLIEPLGAVALFADHHLELPINAWLKPYRELLSRYAVDDAASAQRKSPGWLAHEGVLLESAFSCLERISVIEQRRTAIDSLIERALSRSVTSPARLGARLDELVREIPRTLAPFASQGAVEEVLESHALIARRRSS